MRQWDLDTDRMTKAQVEANYFDAVAFIEDITASTTNYMPLRMFMKHHKNRSSGLCSRLLTELMKGGIKTRERLALVSSDKGLDSSFSEGQYKIVNVAICHVRTTFKKFDGVSLETEWGQGYYMPPASIKKLKQLVAEHEAKQEDMG